jgi:DNA/RNA endonuclease YhcR with UshA esterase domain
MKTHKLRYLWLAAAFALVGCEQATAPAGAPSAVTVRAYVDLDGSGSFSPGDEPISGARIVLQPVEGGGTALEATTNAEGAARFTGVAPGNYTARFQGDMPDGAELDGASTPVVVAPFQGGEVEAQFRFVYHPGHIEGRVFRADDSFPAPGVLARLFSGGTATGTPVDSIRTDGEGRFSFSLLRPGAYTIELVPVPGITLTDGNVRQVTVRSGQHAPVVVHFTGSPRVTIGEALAGPLDVAVVVEGVVTVPQGAFRSDNMYIQDATGGILVFGVPAGAGYALGDSVRVSGTMSQFGGQRQIVQPTAERLGTGTVPAPRTLTGEQVNALTFEGQLARVPSAEVVSVGGGTGAAFNVTFRDAAGTEFVVRVSGAGTGLTRANFTVGEQYNVTGVLGSFNAVAQLLPRAPNDIGPATDDGTTTIAQVRQRALAGDSTEVVVQGVATVGTGILGATTTTTIYVQDATGGIMVFAAAGTTVETGQRVRVTAVLGHFGRELQLGSSANRAVVEDLGAGTLPAPRTVTGAQIVARTFEGELARVENVEVVTVPTGTGAAFTVIVRDAAGVEFELRVAGAGTGLTRGNFVVGQRYDMTGLLGSFNDAAQLKPRSAADIVAR